jgi:predicted MFS family arabinose efflux permease
MSLDAADQSTIGSTSPQVRAALHIGQTQIGLLATSSTVVGVLVTVPFGVLADRTHRFKVLRICIGAWIVATALVGSAPSFGYMLAAHCVLGLVTGAAAPLIASLVGDLVPREARGRVYSVLLLGELVGSAVGTALSGEIAATLGWRWAYVVLGATGATVLVAVFAAHEPPRRSARVPRPPGTTAAESMTLWQAVRVLLRIRTNVVLVVASALGYYYFTGVQTFAVSLWTDDYDVTTKMAPVLVLLVGVALAIGVIIGGPLGDSLLRRGFTSGRVVAVLVAFAGCVVFLVPALSTSMLALTVPLLLVAGVLLGSANPPLDATRIDIVPPYLLGRAEAVRNALRDGADASAPLLFGVLGTHIGLRHTFLVMTAALVAAGGLGLVALRTYPRDAAAANAADDARRPPIDG